MSTDNFVLDTLEKIGESLQLMQQTQSSQIRTLSNLVDRIVILEASNTELRERLEEERKLRRSDISVLADRIAGHETP